MVKPGIIENAMAKLSRPGVLFKKKSINNGRGGGGSECDGGGGDGSGGDDSGGDGDGGDCSEDDGDGSGSDGDGGDGDGCGGGGYGSGGNCDGDNDGGDKTEGGGGGDGKMGTKMEPKGQHDNRNRFSYHGGDENRYPVGQLHRCYYQKPNVCSIMPY